MFQRLQIQEPLSSPSTLQRYKERLRCVVGKPLFMQIRMQIGMQQWQRQKVSDTEQRIENRLAELHRSMVEDNSQSASASQVQGSIHTPESDDKRYLSSSAKLLWKRAEIASDYSDLNQGLYKQPGIMSEPAVQGRVHPQSYFSVCKGTTKSLFDNGRIPKNAKFKIFFNFFGSFRNL